MGSTKYNIVLLYFMFHTNVNIFNFILRLSLNRFCCWFSALSIAVDSSFTVCHPPDWFAWCEAEAHTFFSRHCQVTVQDGGEGAADHGREAAAARKERRGLWDGEFLPVFCPAVASGCRSPSRFCTLHFFFRALGRCVQIFTVCGCSPSVNDKCCHHLT